MKALELMEAARPLPLPAVNEREEDQQELAEEVNLLLGYSGYSKHLLGNKLGRVLNELGIWVLDSKQVTKYKNEMTKRVQSNPNIARDIWFQYNSLVPGNLGVAFPGQVLQAPSQQMPMPTRYEAGWAVTPVQSFQGTVPKRALADAVRIKKALPDVTFQVHHLEVKAVYDPFLEVSLGDQSYFIHVWDEDSFDA